MHHCANTVLVRTQRTCGNTKNHYIAIAYMATSLTAEHRQHGDKDHHSLSSSQQDHSPRAATLLVAVGGPSEQSTRITRAHTGLAESILTSLTASIKGINTQEACASLIACHSGQITIHMTMYRTEKAGGCTGTSFDAVRHELDEGTRALRCAAPTVGRLRSCFD